MIDVIYNSDLNLYKVRFRHEGETYAFITGEETLGRMRQVTKADVEAGLLTHDEAMAMQVVQVAERD